MRTKIFMLSLAAVALSFACSGKNVYHKTAMPDPQSFNAHFGDMDSDGNSLVNWVEFKAWFPHAEQKVFNAIDLNTDKSLDHDEWHKFKAAHGLKHID